MRAFCGVLEFALCVLVLVPAAGCGGDDSGAAAGTGGVVPLGTGGVVPLGTGGVATPGTGGAGGVVGVVVTGGVGGAAGGAPVADGVPCDVAAVIGPKCTLCHGPVAKFGSPLSLMKPADFQVDIATVMTKPAIKTQFAGKKVFEVASALINSTVVADKMPPVPQPELTPAELTLVTTWLNAGAMGGPCAIVPK